MSIQIFLPPMFGLSSDSHMMQVNESCLVKEEYGHGLCLVCMERLEPKINLFCLRCKAPRLRDWTTGNKSLDSFIVTADVVIS